MIGVIGLYIGALGAICVLRAVGALPGSIDLRQHLFLVEAEEVLLIRAYLMHVQVIEARINELLNGFVMYARIRAVIREHGKVKADGLCLLGKVE